ncbi:MAG: hypothetical protein J6U54_13530 [Clostridiales bacterium]|nr:hypothetical protein [Clostridiales bacterium]
MRLDEFSLDRKVIVSPDLEHQQYASKYYDPVKAHQYYEEHKQLKGNRRSTSTASLNEKGKKAALYVKKQIDEEHKAEREAHNEEIKAQREEAKNTTKGKIDAATKELKSKTEAMKVRLKKMNPAQRKHAQIHMKAEIEKLKKANDENRKALMEEYGAVSKGISEAAAKKRGEISEKYNNKYADELDNMKKDASMLKGKKGGGKNKGYTFVFRRGQQAAKNDSKKAYTFANNKK